MSVGWDEIPASKGKQKAGIAIPAYKTAKEEGTAMQAEDLYLAPEDLYRFGNANDPRLTHVRQPKDMDTIEVNGIVVAVANGKGVSLSTKTRLDNSPLGGWVWLIAKGTTMPAGLKLINDRPGHYSLCPERNMPFDEFKGLLAKLAMKCHRVLKKVASNG